MKPLNFIFWGVPIKMEESSRPLDMLNLSRDKTVMVDLKNGIRYIGKLRAFDIHINIVLEEAEEHETKNTKTIKEIDDHTKEETITSAIHLKRKIGRIFVRGDTITTITPA